MSIYARALRSARELGPVFMIAVGVVLAGTIAGSVLDHRHEVVAEESSSAAVSAVAEPDHTQQLTVGEWGVQITLPLAPELPLVRYANHAGTSIGLSSADLERLGSACQAAHDALGTVIRFPHGTGSVNAPGGIPRNFITTQANFDYVYQMPQNACTQTGAAQTLVNRQTSILREALDTLTPVAQP